MGHTYDSLSGSDEEQPRSRGDEIIPISSNKCWLDKYHLMRYRNWYSAAGTLAGLVLFGKAMPFVPSINLPGLVENLFIAGTLLCCCAALCGSCQREKIYRTMLESASAQPNPFEVQHQRERRQKRHSSRRARTIRAPITTHLLSDHESSASEDEAPPPRKPEPYVSITVPPHDPGLRAERQQPTPEQAKHTPTPPSPPASAPDSSAPVSQWMQFMHQNKGFTRVPGL